MVLHHARKHLDGQGIILHNEEVKTVIRMKQDSYIDLKSNGVNFERYKLAKEYIENCLECKG